MEGNHYTKTKDSDCLTELKQQTLMNNTMYVADTYITIMQSGQQMEVIYLEMIEDILANIKDNILKIQTDCLLSKTASNSQDWKG